jgi:hypothetical protein
MRRKKRHQVPKKDDLERAKIPKPDSPVRDEGTAEVSIKKED